MPPRRLIVQVERHHRCKIRHQHLHRCMPAHALQNLLHLLRQRDHRFKIVAVNAHRQILLHARDDFIESILNRLRKFRRSRRSALKHLRDRQANLFLRLGRIRPLRARLKNQKRFCLAHRQRIRSHIARAHLRRHRRQFRNQRLPIRPVRRKRRLINFRKPHRLGKRHARDALVERKQVPLIKPRHK